VYVVAGLIPPTPFADQARGLALACQTLIALGIGAVRDPLVQRDDLLLYQAAREQGTLGLRVRPPGGRFSARAYCATHHAD